MTQAMPQPAAATPAANAESPLAGASLLFAAAVDGSAATLESSLRRFGVKQIVWRRTVGGVETALTEGRFDSVVIDLSLPGGDAIDLVRRIRLGEVGYDPFLPIIVTTWVAKGGAIGAALEAGADDVLAKPVNPAKLAQRVERMATERKPFIAADGYIGPVRARMKGVLKNAPTFEPPNSLKALAQGGGVMTPEGMAALEQAKRRLTGMRVNVCVQDLANAARRALAAEPPMSEPAAAKLLTASAKALDAIVKIVPNSNLNEELKRLASLGLLAVEKGQTTAGERAAKLAVQIADAISLTLSTRQEGSLDLPAQIVASINNLLSELHLQSEAEETADEDRDDAATA